MSCKHKGVWGARCVYLCLIRNCLLLLLWLLIQLRYELYRFAVPLLNEVLPTILATWDPLSLKATREFARALLSWRNML